jgi:hypothetical protein
MTPDQFDELCHALTDALLKDASNDDIYGIASRLVYDGYLKYSEADLKEEAECMNVPFPDN